MLVLSLSIEVRVGPVVLWRKRESRNLPPFLVEAFLPVVNERGGFIVLWREGGVTLAISKVQV